jgi:hypothetical protein
VARVADEEDGRVLQAQLTRRGRARFAAARRAHLADVHALFLDPLTERQRETLATAWAAIGAALPQQPDEPEPARARDSARRPRGGRAPIV